jgi:hypothetical protein
VDGLLHAFGRTEAARVCADPVGAYANCLALSARCAEALRAGGVACGLLHLAGSRATFPYAAGRWPWYDPADAPHWTVRVGDWSIDWTARQFRPEAALPEILPVAALPARWLLVEDWACPRCDPLIADPRHMELTPPGLGRRHRAVARTSGGRGPFPDPRHEGTPPLTLLCTHLAIDGLQVGQGGVDVGAAFRLPVAGPRAAGERRFQLDGVAAAVEAQHA